MLLLLLFMTISFFNEKNIIKLNQKGKKSPDNAIKCCFYLLKQGFIQKKIGSENGPFTKIGDLKTSPFTKIGNLKMDPSKKSATLKWTLKLKIIF